MSTMIYQLIDVTLKYRKYPTLIKSDLKYFEFGDLPAMTLCRKDHDWRFESKRKDSDRSILYHFRYNSSQQWAMQVQLSSPPKNWDKYFNSMSVLIETNVDSFKCLTIFSKLQLKYKENQTTLGISKPSITLWILDVRDTDSYHLALHPSNQMVKSSNQLSKSHNLRHIRIFSLQVKTEYLLPSPFETNCFDYNENIGKNHSKAYRSHQECMEKEECKRNEESNIFSSLWIN
jgi:hypothetical protein